jgi:haloacetate dehalogenase
MSDWFAGFELARLRVGDVPINLRHNLGAAAGKPPLLLLHGFPQTHAMWHKVASVLAGHFALVLPDLRGYGDSGKPQSDATHAAYSKRTMAADNVALMAALGVDRFAVCGHDRGGRVAHRMALDHPQAVERLMLLDISPTLTMYERTDMDFARAYYHWFFLIQPEPLPEKLIGADPAFYLRNKLGGWGSHGLELFDPRALAEYERCIGSPATIHAMCEDYRAAASIDLEHDRADARARIACPLRVLWGERGVVHRLFAPITDWQAKASGTVTGRPTPGGHYIAEETPELLADDMLSFFGRR